MIPFFRKGFKDRMNSTRSCSIFFAVLFCLPCCYRMVKQDAGFDFQKASPSAVPFLEIIEQKNTAIKSFKGIGKIRLWDLGQTQTARAAWMGAKDGRLRIEFLGLPGQPVAKFIFDGDRYVFFSHVDQLTYSQNSEDPDLAPVTGVSIKTSEVIDLLAGGIPVYAHDSVVVKPLGSDNRHVVVFEKHWLGAVEKVYFNSTAPEKIEVFRWGKKVYQAEISDIRSIGGQSVPFQLVIENSGGEGFSFEIDRQWVDVDVRPAMFEITPMD